MRSAPFFLHLQQSLFLFLLFKLCFWFWHQQMVVYLIIGWKELVAFLLGLISIPIYHGGE